MNQRHIVVSLIVIMVAGCLLISGIAILILYRTSMQEVRNHLMETVRSQARLIETMARFDKEHSRDYPGGARSATLSQIINAHEGHITFGNTGEFVISERVGQNMVFLCRHRDANNSTPAPVPFRSELAEPMRRALSGRSGTLVGLDYGGVLVLAAHEPVAELGLGIVAKIDLSEVRAPFVHAGLIVLAFTVLVVLVGAGLFVRIARPMVDGLEEQNAAMKNLNKEMEAEIALRREVVSALRKSERDLEIRNRISEIFLTVPDEKIYQQTLTVVLEALESENGTLAYIQDGDMRVIPAFVDGGPDIDPPPEKGILFPQGTWGGTIWDRCRQEKKSVYSEGPFDLPQGHVPLKRILIVPIMHKDEVIGGLMVGNRPTPYHEDDIHLLDTIADFIAPVLAAKLEKDLLEKKRQQAERKLQEAHDLLEQRVEERTNELNEHKMRLQSVVNGIPDPLFLLDESMRIELLNKAAAIYYSSAEEGAVGCICHEIFRRRTEPCDGCQVPAAIQEGINISYERKGMNDPARLEQVTVYQVEDGGERSKEAILRIHDITDAKLIERREARNEKLATLGLMVSSIAHEIANPVGAVTFNAPILKDYVEAIIPILDDHFREEPNPELVEMPYAFFRKDVLKIVENILHAAHRIKATVNDLRRLYGESKARSKSWVSLGQVIEGVMGVIGVELNQAIKTFDVNLPEDMPEMYTDAEAVEQVLTNLLSNAMHAADKEMSRVTIDAFMGPTWQEHFIIEVRDNGSGMDADTLAKVFKPFFTTKAPGKGTGLGLYVCKDLIQGLGGTIEVESQIGQGTVFRIKLPDIEKRSVKRL